MKLRLFSTNIIIASLLSIALICLIEVPSVYTTSAATFPEQNCISNGGNGGSAGNGGSPGNDGIQITDNDKSSNTAYNTSNKISDREIQNARSIHNDDVKSIGRELTQEDPPEGVQGGGDGGNGGDGGRAMTMCILIAPVINIDSNIPFEPNALLERPNLSYAPYLRMG
jgi:hypothetical protein